MEAKQLTQSECATEKLFYTDSYMQEFDAVVTACERYGDAYRVVLDRTAFFPEGGGQAGDTGTLQVTGHRSEGSADAWSAHIVTVTDTREKNGIIYHTADAPLPVGADVHGTLNFDQRFERMQQHTGEHIISGIVHSTFGYNNVGFHLGEDITTLDFDQELNLLQVYEVEERANRAVFENLPVGILYPSGEELQMLDYRSKIEIEGQVRLVSIPGTDLCACCAPHTKTTGAVGLIKILSCERHRGGCRMVMVSGIRALKDYQTKQRSVETVSRELSARPDRIGEAVRHAREQQAKLRERLNRMQAVYLNEKLDAIRPEDTLVCIFEEEMDNMALRSFVNNAMERCGGICAAFVGTDESGYRYILGSRAADMRVLAKQLNEQFGGRGGGSPEMIQGSLPGLRVDVERWLANFVL